ncbi:MAG: hypothetical protein WCF65_03605 [Parachlamydiaceae bacterium]
MDESNGQLGTLNYCHLKKARMLLPVCPSPPAADRSAFRLDLEFRIL